MTHYVVPVTDAPHSIHSQMWSVHDVVDLIRHVLHISHAQLSFCTSTHILLICIYFSGWPYYRKKPRTIRD